MTSQGKNNPFMEKHSLLINEDELRDFFCLNPKFVPLLICPKKMFIKNLTKEYFFI